MRSPVIKSPRAAGIRKWEKIQAGEAPKERATSIWSREGAVSPLEKATIIGKIPNNATSKILEVAPKPNQMISRGAITTIGMVCEITNSGITAFPKVFALHRRKEITTPQIIASEVPASTSIKVTCVASEAAGQSSIPALKITLGAGNSLGLTCPRRQIASHNARDKRTRPTATRRE